MYFNGLQVITNDFLYENSNIPVKRNKNKRIQKKWIKKYGYKKIPDKNVYIIDGRIVGHTATIKRIMESIERK